MAFKKRVGPLGVQAVERRLAEGRRFQDTSGGEMVDDQLDEADLAGGEAPVVQEPGERRLGGGQVAPIPLS